MTTFIVNILNDKFRPGKQRVKLYEATIPLNGAAVGDFVGEVIIDDDQHIGAALKTLLDDKYGNPPEKPPLRNLTISATNSKDVELAKAERQAARLRNVNQFIRDGIDATLAGQSTLSPRRIDRTGGA